MPNDLAESRFEAAGSWAKKYFFASRALMEDVLRPYDLGNTQWYVLFRLANSGPVTQRDLTRELEVERATLSEVIGVLVRKNLVIRATDPDDQRRKVLHLTADGRGVWDSLPDPIAAIAAVAFEGVDPADVATTQRVLADATRRMLDHRKKGTDHP